MRVRYAPRARDVAADILRHVEGRSSSGARTLKAAIRSSAALVGRHPGIGTLAGEADIRVLPLGRFPYLIYWVARAGIVTILHVRHASRRRPGAENPSDDCA